MDWQGFGAELLRTGDLDPIYNMLWGSALPRYMIDRWLVAYWCYYDAGTASWIAEAPTGHYWNRFRAALPFAPRGRERRHFRGPKAEVAVEKLSQMGDASNIVLRLFSGQREFDGSIPFRTVMKNAEQLPQFGPWIGFKIADMGERVLDYPVSFDAGTLWMYKDPVQGAALLETGDPKEKITKAQLENAVARIWRLFGDVPAPPKYDRLVNLQEVETILCKFKSHWRGNYAPGTDIKDVTRALQRERTDLSQQLLRSLQQETDL